MDAIYARYDKESDEDLLERKIYSNLDKKQFVNALKYLKMIPFQRRFDYFLVPIAEKIIEYYENGALEGIGDKELLEYSSKILEKFGEKIPINVEGEQLIDMLDESLVNHNYVEALQVLYEMEKKPELQEKLINTTYHIRENFHFSTLPPGDGSEELIKFCEQFLKAKKVKYELLELPENK